MGGFLLFVGLILFVGLVIVHEYGHYKAARRGGVDVEEFGIGFPPKAWGRKLKSGMLLSINLLPLGGFVKLKGEHDADTHPGSYGAAPLKTKVKILLAGVFMNLITALGILTALAFIGMPKLFDNQFTIQSDTEVVQNNVLVGYVEEDSPAAEAGIEQRDEIISVSTDNSTIEVTSASQLPDITKQFAGQNITMTIERGEQTTQKTVRLRTQQEVDASKGTDEPKGYLGVVPTEYTVQRSTWSAPITAVGTAGQFTWLTLKGIGTALAGVFTGNGGQAAEQVSGPVGIFVLIKDGAYLGFGFILMIIAVISLTLAIMNVLPIPALDGGKLFVTLLFRGLKKPLKPRTEDLIHGTGFALLMLLFVLITVVDVRRFF